MKLINRPGEMGGLGHPRGEKFSLVFSDTSIIVVLEMRGLTGPRGDTGSGAGGYFLPLKCPYKGLIGKIAVWVMFKRL